MFLVRLLRAHLGTRNHLHAFTTTDGALQPRSNFSRPAADGILNLKKAVLKRVATTLGLTFHGLRHSHKAWMVEDAIPEIAQASDSATSWKAASTRPTRTSPPWSRPAGSPQRDCSALRDAAYFSEGGSNVIAWASW